MKKSVHTDYFHADNDEHWRSFIVSILPQVNKNVKHFSQIVGQKHGSNTGVNDELFRGDIMS